MRILALLMMACFAQSAYAVKYFEPGQGLPDYDKNSPFTTFGPQRQAELTQAIGTITPADLGSIEKPCSAGPTLANADEGWQRPLLTNICNPSKFSALKHLVSSMAPGFDESRLTLWIVDLQTNGVRDLLIEYVDISKDENFPYPYLSLWQFKPDGQTFRVRYAGPFLNGALFAIRPFGENSTSQIVFIKHASCIECEPTIYLTPIDFDAVGDAHPYEFSYSEQHDSFDPTIEYELPGMGHTVDATVEVRTLPPSTAGPHLLQFYKMEEGEGPDEWWMFTCIHYKCDYKIYKSKAPEGFEKLWKVAKPL